MTKKERNNLLKFELSNPEISESMMIPEEMSKSEEKFNSGEIKKIRLEMLHKMTDNQKIYSDILQLKFRLEKYLNQSIYDDSKSFGKILTDYIRIVREKNKEFASHISIHASRLSRIIKDKEPPNVEFLYRLEKHSGGLISAIVWWKILVKMQGNEIQKNSKKREEEWRKVNHFLSFNV